MDDKNSAKASSSSSVIGICGIADDELLNWGSLTLRKKNAPVFSLITLSSDGPSVPPRLALDDTPDNHISEYVTWIDC